LGSAEAPTPLGRGVDDPLKQAKNKLRPRVLILSNLVVQRQRVYAKEKRTPKLGSAGSPLQWGRG